MKRTKRNVTDILSASVFERVAFLLKESECVFLNKDRTLSDKDTELIKDSLMQEDKKKKEEAQIYVNFYNALMQFSNFAAESSTNFDKHCCALSSFVDMLAQSERTAARIVEEIKSGKLEQKEGLSIMFSLDNHDAFGFIKVRNGVCEIELEAECNYHEKMMEQSQKTKQALARYKAWIDAVSELIDGADEKIWEIIPFNFSVIQILPNFLSDDDKYHVFPVFDDTPRDADEYKIACNLLNLSLEQWNISRKQVAILKRCLKRKR